MIYKFKDDDYFLEVAEDGENITLTLFNTHNNEELGWVCFDYKETEELRDALYSLRDKIKPAPVKLGEPDND